MPVHPENYGPDVGGGGGVSMAAVVMEAKWHLSPSICCEAGIAVEPLCAN
jgi:hypothetical protein